MTTLHPYGRWTGAHRGTVVFIHGLNGHHFDTWHVKNDDTTFWPNWLGADIKGLNIFSLGYDASSRAGPKGIGLFIQDRGQNVLECLLLQHKQHPAPLFLIGHSLGGLIIKQVVLHAIERARNDPAAVAFLQDIAGVVFIGTPHTGSYIASLAKVTGAHDSKNAAQLIANDPTLRDNNTRYRAQFLPRTGGATDLTYPHRVFFETQGPLGIEIVDAMSADPVLPNATPIPIEADHSEICKPKSRTDLIYRQIAAFVSSELDVKSPALGSAGIFQESEPPPRRSGIGWGYILLIFPFSILGTFLMQNVLQHDVVTRLFNSALSEKYQTVATCAREQSPLGRIAHCSDQITIDPNNLDAYANRALAHLERSEFLEARSNHQYLDSKLCDRPACEILKIKLALLDTEASTPTPPWVAELAKHYDELASPPLEVRLAFCSLSHVFSMIPNRHCIDNIALESEANDHIANPLILRELLNYYLLDARFDKARQYANRYISALPDDPTGYILRARLLTIRNTDERFSAAKDLDRARQLDPTNPTLGVAEAAFAVRFGLPFPEDAMRRLRNSQFKYYAELSDAFTAPTSLKAVELLTNILKSNSRNPIAWFALAQARLGTEPGSPLANSPAVLKSQEHLSRAIAFAPAAPGLYIWRAYTYKLTNNVPDCKRNLDHVDEIAAATNKINRSPFLYLMAEVTNDAFYQHPRKHALQPVNRSSVLATAFSDSEFDRALVWAGALATPTIARTIKDFWPEYSIPYFSLSRCSTN